MKIVEEIVKRHFSDDGSVWLPPDETQPLVRCKDCKMSNIEKTFKNVPESKDTVRWCELIQRYVDDDWFCADGERK